jgi:hypothetical protein
VLACVATRLRGPYHGVEIAVTAPRARRLQGDGSNCVAGDDPVTLPTCRGGCDGYGTAQRVPPKGVQAESIGTGVAHADASTRVAEAAPLKQYLAIRTTGIACYAGRSDRTRSRLVIDGLLVVLAPPAGRCMMKLWT